MSDEKKTLLGFGLGFIIFGIVAIVYTLFTTIAITIFEIVQLGFAIMTFCCGGYLLSQYEKKYGKKGEVENV